MPIAGASGGVGCAAVQLAKRRSAHEFAVASAATARTVTVCALGPDTIDVAVGLVAGTFRPRLADAPRRGGRAIAVPAVELDVQTFWLGNLMLFGCAFLEDEVCFLYQTRRSSFPSRPNDGGVR